MTSYRQTIIPPLWVVSIAVLALGVWLMMQLKELFFLLLIGYCIAYIMHPALNKLEQHGVRRSLGTLAIFAVVFIFIFTFAITVVPTFTKEYQEFSFNFPRYVQTAKERAVPMIDFAVGFFPGMGRFVEEPAELLKVIPRPSAETIRGLTAGVGSALLSGYSITLTLVNLLLLPFIVFYLAVDFKRLDDGFLAVFPVLARDQVRKILEEIDAYVSAFVRGQILIGAILSVLYAIGLGLLGVQLWFFLAIISGFGNMIPYLGTITGIVFGTIMALVTFGDFGSLLMVWAVYAAVQVIEGNFVTPKVLGEKVGLSPLVIILALLAGGTLFGLIGVVLAVPGVAVLRVLSKYFYRWYLREGGLA